MLYKSDKYETGTSKEMKQGKNVYMVSVDSIQLNKSEKGNDLQLLNGEIYFLLVRCIKPVSRFTYTLYTPGRFFCEISLLVDKRLKWSKLIEKERPTGPTFIEHVIQGRWLALLIVLLKKWSISTIIDLTTGTMTPEVVGVGWSKLHHRNTRGTAVEMNEDVQEWVVATWWVGA